MKTFCAEGHATRLRPLRGKVDLQLIQVTHFGDYAVKLNKELTVLLCLSTTIKSPALCRQLLVESAEKGLLHFVGECHIVFEGVQSSQYKVE